MEPWNGKFELLDPMIILIDHQYQRPEKPNLIDAIDSHPRWEAFQVITCFKRTSGNGTVRYYCVDGQQRLRGILRSESPPKEVPVVVYELSGVREEAEVFVRINEYRKALSAIEKHTSKLVAKDPAAVAIERVCERVGYTVGNSYSAYSDTNTIQAIGSLNRVYNLVGEEGLEQTLVQLRDSWPHDRAAIAAEMIVAVGNLIAEMTSDQNGG